VLRRIGGARTVANILNAMERDKSSDELGLIEQADGEMHQQIKDLLFVFDNLLDVDDRRHTDAAARGRIRHPGVACAVRNPSAGQDIEEHVEACRRILKDDMEARGPVKLADVEAAQKEIIGDRTASGRGRHHQFGREGSG